MTQTTSETASGGTAFQARPKVAGVSTRPETVLDDVGRAMRLADYQTHLPVDIPTLLKINKSWQHYYPACSTTPWPTTSARPASWPRR